MSVYLFPLRDSLFKKESKATWTHWTPTVVRERVKIHPSRGNAAALTMVVAASSPRKAATAQAKPHTRPAYFFAVTRLLHRVRHRVQDGLSSSHVPVRWSYTASMTLRGRWPLLAVCLTTCSMTAPAQEPTSRAAVVLSRIEVSYPGIAESGRVGGKVSVRVRVRPDGTVYETTLLQGLPLLSAAAVDAASRARFECHECTEPSTPHVIVFVFSADGSDSAGNRLPNAWKQTGDASSEVTVFGYVPVIYAGPPSEPFHVRAARCLWLWHCSKQAYARVIY